MAISIRLSASSVTWPFFMSVPRHAVYAHIDRRQIVGCPNDQVSPGNESVFIGRVVVDQRSARGFDTTHPAAGFGTSLRFEYAGRLFAGLREAR